MSDDMVRLVLRCRCGGSISVTTPSVSQVGKSRDAFLDAHQHCNSLPPAIPIGVTERKGGAS